MLKTTSHIILSVLFFTLSVGVNINKHFSNGKLYSQSFFGEAESCDAAEGQVCSMQNMPSECKTHTNQDTEKNTEPSCCENTSEYIHFDEDFTVPKKINVNQITKSKVTISSNIIFVNNNLQYSKTPVQIRNTGNSPPIIPISASVLQVFKC